MDMTSACSLTAMLLSWPDKITQRICNQTAFPQFEFWTFTPNKKPALIERAVSKFAKQFYFDSGFVSSGLVSPAGAISAATGVGAT